MAIHISKPTPLTCISLERYNEEEEKESWRLSDVCVSETDVIAVAGYHTQNEETFIALFNNISNSKSPQLVSCLEFETQGGLKFRLVCFLGEDDKVVTCIGERVSIVEPREKKTLKHRELQRKVEYLTVWNGNIFVVFFNSRTVHGYDRQLNLVNDIQLEGIPRQDSCISISFSLDAYFVCTAHGRAMKLSTKDGLAVYEFDGHTNRSALGLEVSVRQGVAVIFSPRSEIHFYSIDDNSLILVFDVDDKINRIRMSDRGTIVTSCHYKCKVKVYNLPELLSYDQSKSKGIVDQHHVKKLPKGLFKFDMKSPHSNEADTFQTLRQPSTEQPQILSPTPPAEGECSGSVKFPDEDPESKRKQTDTYKSERDITTKKKQKILRTTPISQEENETQTSTENIFLKAQTTIGQSGGTIEVPNTHVKLHIPPNALPEAVGNCLIQLRIIPQRMLKDNAEATFWNTSTAVELLPNNLQLRKHVKLILPHCFALKGPRPRAKVLVSHHEQGNIPLWEEEADCDYMVEKTTCIVRLKRFCWVRLRINDNEILAKTLVLYTAGKRPMPNCNKFTVVFGYYPDLPGEDKFLQLNPSLIVSELKRFNYFKEGENPLRLWLTETVPQAWRLCVPNENVEEIAFATISSSIEHSQPFTFQNKGKRNELPILHFKASQEGGMQAVELTINLEELRDRSPQPEAGHSNPMKRLCWELCEELTCEWKAVGRNLNISDAQLHQVEVDNAGNIKETIYAMFLHWLQQGGESATRSTLSSALKDAGRTDLAFDLN